MSTCYCRDGEIVTTADHWPTCPKYDPLASLADAGGDAVTVCPVHLRFVPCRRCTPGEEWYSSDPHDVERTKQFQWGGQ